MNAHLTLDPSPHPMRRGKDAQWSGLYDRMHAHEPDETERRLELAATFGESLDA